MYEMYPDWGPAKHYASRNEEESGTDRAVRASLDLRDTGGERPDDN